MGGYGETSFRANNRQFRLLVGQFVSLADREPVSFVCECASEQCFAPVEISLAEFDAVCADDDHRLVAPGHQVAGEQAVVETPAYAVVRLAEPGEGGFKNLSVTARVPQTP
jgi:hypothetical protein